MYVCMHVYVFLCLSACLCLSSGCLPKKILLGFFAGIFLFLCCFVFSLFVLCFQFFVVSFCFVVVCVCVFMFVFRARVFVIVFVVVEG